MNVAFTSDGRFPEGLSSANFFSVNTRKSGSSDCALSSGSRRLTFQSLFTFHIFESSSAFEIRGEHQLMNVTFTSDGRFHVGLSSANFFSVILEKVDLQTALYPLGVAALRFTHCFNSV